MQMTVLSEKERKFSLIMFRKICNASGVLPTLRIDLYAGDQLKSTCNPYVVFQVKGCEYPPPPPYILSEYYQYYNTCVYLSSMAFVF